MLDNANSIIPIASRFRRSLAAGLVFLRKNKTTPPNTTSTTSAEDNLWLSATMSAFNEAESIGCSEDEPEEDVNPLVEAEIYAIFGRTNDAEHVLKSALQAGRVTADEVARFWDGLETEPKSILGR